MHEWIAASDDVVQGRTKELHYFDGRDDCSLEGYLKMFRGEANKCTLDSTPVYVYESAAVERIRRCLGGEDLRVIVCLRDPVSRAISHYRMNRRRGVEVEGLARALSRLDVNSETAYVHRGVYAPQISRAIRTFGADGVIFVDFERFVKNDASEKRRLADFLDMPDLVGVEVRPANAAWVPRSRWVTKLSASRQLRAVLRNVIPPRVHAFLMSLVTTVPPRSETVEGRESVPDPVLEMFRKDREAVCELLNSDVSWHV